jgi:hypothetical protein
MRSSGNEVLRQRRSRLTDSESSANHGSKKDEALSQNHQLLMFLVLAALAVCFVVYRFLLS